MNKKKNCLITGSSGFLGSILVNSLQFSFEIDTLSRLNNCTYNVDLSIEVPVILGNHDIVLHCAGKAHYVPNTSNEEQVFFDVNLQGTKNLCYGIESMSNKPAAFIFISTVAVYGLEKGTLINENYPLDGCGAYARSKILAEEWLKKWAAKNHIILTILRLPLIAGPNPLGNLCSMISSIKKGRYLSIGKADAKKSIVWATDIATLVPIAAEKGGIYNLTDGYHPTLAELENCIASGFHIKKPKEIPLRIAKVLGYIGDILGRYSPVNSDKIKKLTSTLTFDDSLAVKELNWKPTPVLTKLPSIL